MSNCNLILELYSEEIPARIQAQTESLFRDILTKHLKMADIDVNYIKVFTGPCRIAILINFLYKEIAARTIEYKGPKVSDASDTAIDGFCRAKSIQRQDLVIKNFHQQDYYSYSKTIPSIPVQSLMPEIITAVLREITWTKSMRWGDYKINWIRPLKNIMCIFDDGNTAETIKVDFGHLTANNKSFGHKFMSPESFTVSSWPQYQEQLAQKYVILDRSERKRMILTSLQTKCNELGVTLNYNEKLLDEVTGLVEYPTILYSSIPEKFMSLPEEIIITSVHTHQKYFTTHSSSSKKLAPYFLFVTNIISEDFSNIIKGNERVLLSRLSDGLYFFQADCCSSLYDKLPQLKRVIFHANLGCMFDKTQRIKKICMQLMPNDTELITAAELCKVDLITEVVQEFPNLQGIMGKYYALNDGLSSQIATAIEQHYLPMGPNDPVPKDLAAILSLADKIDSLTSLYIAGERSTSSKDPLGLRRYAFAIVRIILDNAITVKLMDLINFVCQQHQNSIIHNKNADLVNEIFLFIRDKAQYLLKDKFNPLLIKAILQQYSYLDDLVEIVSYIDVLSTFIQSNDGQKFLQSYKRAYNIIRNISSKVITLTQIDVTKLCDQYEKSLHQRIITTNEQIIQYSNTKSSIAVCTAKNLQAKLHCLLELTMHIDAFLDHVMVNDNDVQLALNRHIMLKYIIQISNSIIDFSLLIDL